MGTRKNKSKIIKKNRKTRSKKGGEKPVDTVDKCSICLEPMDTVKDLESLETTGCTHTFHKHCLKEWCLTEWFKNQTCTCPMCKRAIPNTCAILTNYKTLCGGKRKMKRKTKRKTRKNKKKQEKNP
jgi:hypothetical protein